MNAPLENSSRGSSLNDIEFLVRSEYRVGVLDALAVHPCDRTDLRAVTGASSPTMGRILGDFEERRWIVRNGRTYELTQLGEFVTERFFDLREAMGIERKLRDVWQWLPHEMDGFRVELLADAVVSYPGAGYPYQPIERVTQLIEETERMRGFGMAVLKSSNLDAFCRRILDGMECEYIYPPPILDACLSWNPERVAEVAVRDNYDALLHDTLPSGNRCGITIYDDRVGICCHDPDTGMVRAHVDTDAPEVREWAEAIYEQVRGEARPVGDEDTIGS